jgi:hypothetical protein
MKILQFFQEDNGNFSATRLGFLAYTFGLVAQLGINAYRGSPFAPSENAVWILVALMTGKAVQKFGEKPGG